MVGPPAAWQFVRGVRGASDFEAARSYEFALEQASSRAIGMSNFGTFGAGSGR
jgi:hypothetical protein